MARKFPHTFEVCTCRHVILAEIIYAIKEKNAKTLEDLANITDAGTCCKSCINPECDLGVEKMELYLEEILNKFNKE
ncbi:MAG: (2Fe-2S)-binding protein [Aliarcobacter sp.]|jgi:NAD(P)H-nitrite reductase large subunit|nr:(2Fe-2S)-binding protein [Aliarcobacter sp.]